MPFWATWCDVPDILYWKKWIITLKCWNKIIANHNSVGIESCDTSPMNLFVAVDKMQSWKESNVLRLTWARWKSFNISPEIRFCTYNQMFWKVANIHCLLATQTQHPSRECSQLLRKIRNWTRNYLADANFIKFFGFLLNSSNINQSH